jgi:antitoxin component of RelBE/YafQ-DinJ toxin-antitoxin module
MAKRPGGGRRKPASGRKDEFIKIRVTTEQKERFTAAAERAGLDVSAWLRTVGLRAAQER